MRTLTSFCRRVGGASLILTVALLATGCPVANRKGTGPKDGAAARKAHDHDETGPHGGPLAEWGEEEYHAEFTVDHAKKQATVYILDGNARKAAPIDVEAITLRLTSVEPHVPVTLKADPQEGDPKGQASRFTGTHEALAGEGLKGEISGTVAGTPYAGPFEEKDRDSKLGKKK
jgi:hypothetical protein